MTMTVQEKRNANNRNVYRTKREMKEKITSSFFIVVISVSLSTILLVAGYEQIPVVEQQQKIRGRKITSTTARLQPTGSFFTINSSNENENLPIDAQTIQDAIGKDMEVEDMQQKLSLFPGRYELYPMNSDPLHPTTTETLTAVVHVGPEKTGSSAIQSVLRATNSILETQDNFLYTMNHKYILENYLEGQRHSMSELTNCFNSDPHYKLNGDPCNEKVYDAFLQFGKYGSHPTNVIVSSERLYHSLLDLDHFHDYLTTNWDNVIIVMYYRRYFEWLLSLHFQGQRIMTVPKRRSIVDHVRSEVTSEVDVHGKFTIGVLERYLQHFPNATSANPNTPYTQVKIFNVHDPMTQGDVRQSFVCEAIPNANHACDYLHNDMMVAEANQKHRRAQTRNTKYPLVYENLVYYAQQIGLYNPTELLQKNSMYTDDYIAQKVRYYNEVELKRDENGFDILDDYDDVSSLVGVITCPTDEEYDWLYKQTIVYEQKIVPHYHFEQGGREEIDKNFPLTKSRFCHVDAQLVMSRNQRWQQYFKTLSFM